MPYTRITKTKSASASIDYLRGHGHGHNNEHLRNQMISGVNMLPDGALSFEAQMGRLLRHKSSRNKTEGWRVIQSFGPEELNADEPSDVAKAHEIGIRLAEEMWPGFEVAVFTQTDGKGHKVHNHLFVCNVNKETYKGCNHDQTFHLRIKEKSDEICGQFIDIKEPEKVSERVPQAVRAKREINAQREANGEEPIYIWQDDLKARIRDAASQSINIEEFQELLIARGVEMDIKKPTKTHPERVITYELVDITKFEDGEKIPWNLKCRSYKLGADFELPQLEKQFGSNMKGRLYSPKFEALMAAHWLAKEAAEKAEEEPEEVKEEVEVVPAEEPQKEEIPEEKAPEDDQDVVPEETPEVVASSSEDARLERIEKRKAFLVEEKIKEKFATDESTAHEIAQQFTVWQKEREESGIARPFFEVSEDGRLGVAPKALDAAVTAYHQDVMAEATYQSRHQKRSEDPEEEAERRRKALARKAVMQQMTQQRMENLSYDASRMVAEHKQQALEDEKE